MLDSKINRSMFGSRSLVYNYLGKTKLVSINLKLEACKDVYLLPNKCDERLPRNVLADNIKFKKTSHLDNHLGKTTSSLTIFYFNNVHVENSIFQKTSCLHNHLSKTTFFLTMLYYSRLPTLIITTKKQRSC